jgi:hypothetical protein
MKTICVCRMLGSSVVAAVARCRSLFIVLPVALSACSRPVPADIKPTLEAIQPDARKVAEAAAKVCGDQFKSGRFKASQDGYSVELLPGETMVPPIPSPAKGSSLESNALVLEVRTECDVPVRGGDYGSGLTNLKRPVGAPSPSRSRHVVQGNCKSDSTDCEEVIVPSQTADDEDSTDLRIVKPVSGGPSGATVMLTVTLAKK